MRNRAIVVALLAVIVASAGPAQAGLIPQFGVKGGLNLSDINIDDLESSTRTGWVAGLYCSLSPALLRVQPELLLTSKGFEGGEVSTSDTELNFRNLWLEVPVLLVWTLPIPAVSPSVYLGPAVSFPLQSEVQIDDGDWVDVKDETQTTWSAVMGVGVNLGPLGVEVRYDLGLTDISDEPLGELIESIPDDVEGKDFEDRTWSLLASFGF